MPKNTVQSVEPNIADLVNGWLKSYNLDYKLEQESLNDAIDKALDEYKSKQGGSGGNRPDCKLLATDAYGSVYPVLIEYKGYRDRLVKLDETGNVAIKTADNKDDFKSINSYAVNGAVHYANALLHYTNYEDIISIGVTGWRDESGSLQSEIGVYYVSDKNYGYGQEELPKYAAVFVTTACHKSAHNGQFSYSRNFYAKDADELFISLPVKDGKPDYDAMDAFISAVQKLVIKDVVQYADMRIAATKEVAYQIPESYGDLKVAEPEPPCGE